MQDSKLLKQWKVAAADLGLEIVASYELDIGTGSALKSELLVKDFGATNGMLVVTSYAPIKPYLKQIHDLGYGFSVLQVPRNPANEAYNRGDFIDMLSDWGWTGSEAAKPSWLRTL
jgi:hypothetical protein